MGAVGEVGATSFDAYEGIRIVIPGAVTVGIAAGVERTLGAGKPVIGSEAGLVILLALAVGLIFYFVDLPAKSAGYNLCSQPTTFLSDRYGRTKDRSGLTPGEVLNRYLLLLNTEIPAAIRNRSLYIGSMYRIAFEAILVTSVAAYLVMLIAATRPIATPTPTYWRSACIAVLGAFATAIVAAWVTAVNYERKRSHRDDKPLNTAREVRRAFKRTILVPHMVVYGVGLFLVGICPIRIEFGEIGGVLGERWRIAGGLIAMTYWLVRYMAGDPPDNRGASITQEWRTSVSALRLLLKTYTVGIPGSGVRTRVQREPMNPMAAAVLLSAPLLVTWVRLLDSQHIGVSSPRVLIAWATLQLALFTLVASRGHERKLHGAYSGQNKWIELNPQICDAFFDPDGGPERVAELREVGANAASPRRSPPGAD